MPPPSDARLSVLITNQKLANRSGTELYVRDLALGLLQRGHRPIVYSPRLGAVAAEIRTHTIPVIDNLAAVAEAPDIIHGNYGLETLTALLAFPGVPAVAMCHSWVGWADRTVVSPRIGRYLAVDDTCRDRLVREQGISPDRVDVVLNAVDLDRFRPRPPLPRRPGRALIFSNAAGAHTPYVQAIHEACRQSGIAVEIAGAQSGRPLERPEDMLGGYDLVFAKARAALEAAAVGTAVVLCDVAGSGPMVTTTNLAAMRRLNFGKRALRNVPSADVLAAEIAHYDADDAAEVSRQIRDRASRDVLLDHLLAVYAEVLADPGCPDVEAEMRAAAEYLRQLSPKLYERDQLKGFVMRLLRVPLAGRWLHRRARRDPPAQWLRELLHMMDKE